MSSINDWLNGSLKSINHKSFKDVVKVTAEVEPMSHGQVVIISDINRVVLSIETSSGERRKLKAIAKLEPPTGPGKVLADDCEAFENEIMMYTKVLKNMETLMSEVGDNNYMWPESYHCADKKLLLQDLCDAGYRTGPTQELLDVNHALLVMKAIGKFHALSMIMEHKGILNKRQFRPGLVAQGPPFLINIYKLSGEALAQHIKTSWGPEWSTVPERLEKFMDDIKQKLYDLVESSKGEWDVLNHGDFTIRNMLFHYKPNSDIPDDVKFVDFQMTNYNNLGFDLSSLLYSSLMPTVRDSNMSMLLSAYSDSMTDTCKLHGFTGPVPTAVDVAASLNSLNYFSTCVSFCYLPFIIISGKENMQKKTDNSMEMFNLEEIPDGEKKDEVCGSYYQDKQIAQLMEYEVKRCIKENIY